MKKPKRPVSRDEEQARFLLAVLKKCMADLKTTIREEARKSQSKSIPS